MLSAEEFEGAFDRFTREAFRLETLQRYVVDEEAPRIAAFRRGSARPERSVRTSPWLRRIATTTAAGKSWKRIHVVDLPLSEYLQYQVLGYVESQAAGEQVRLLQRTASVDTTSGDFWLFDGGTADAYAIALHYDDEGRYVGADLVTDPTRLDYYREVRDVWNGGTPLNEFLAHLPQPEHARSA